MKVGNSRIESSDVLVYRPFSGVFGTVELFR